MSKASKKKDQAQARILELENQKRYGLLIFAAALVGMVLAISAKLYFQYEVEAEWANTDFASMALFVLALVAAGVAGFGTRKWRKARDEIRAIEKKYKV